MSHLLGKSKLTRGKYIFINILKYLIFSRVLYFISDTTHPICLFCRIQIQICIKGIHGFKLISYALGMDQSEHHHWPPRPPPTSTSACTLTYYATVVGRLRLHRLACLRRCRLVFPPARLAFMPPLLASTSSPTGLPSSPPTGVSACTAGLYAAVVGRLRLHRPACLRRCRLVFPPARWPLCRRCWASTSSPTGLPSSPPTGVSACTAGLYAAVVGVYVFTDRLAFAAADWFFRLHGWPLCRRCWASTSSPTGLPSSPPTGVSACTAGLLCRRCWASTSSPTGLPSPLPTGVSACTAGLLCHRCWASTSSPTGLPSPPPTGVSACTAGLYAAVVGRLRLHRPAASSAADWYFRLHG